MCACVGGSLAGEPAKEGGENILMRGGKKIKPLDGPLRRFEALEMVPPWGGCRGGGEEFSLGPRREERPCPPQKSDLTGVKIYRKRGGEIKPSVVKEAALFPSKGKRRGGGLLRVHVRRNDLRRHRRKTGRTPGRVPMSEGKKKSLRKPTKGGKVFARKPTEISVLFKAPEKEPHLPMARWKEKKTFIWGRSEKGESLLKDEISFFLLREEKRETICSSPARGGKSPLAH